MCTVSEVSCKEGCSCCKSCKGCSNFQKILDLKNAGLVLYRHRNRIDEVNKSTGQTESSINTTDDVFIIHNTKDIQIEAVDCISAVVSDEISCPRCKELVQRAQKYLRNIPPIDKKNVIGVCDHCEIKRRSHNYCSKCHKIVKKFLAERDMQRVTKDQIKCWLSKVHKLLNKLSTERRTKTGLKCRAHSELYLNSLCKNGLSYIRQLEVGPIAEMGPKISESMRSIDHIASKSDIVSMHFDSKSTKFKTVVIKTDSFTHVQRHATSSTVFDDQLLVNEANRIKQKSEQNSRDLKILRHAKSPQFLLKYYSDEEIFLPTADSADNEVKNNFSFIFPKEASDKITPLRRVKTSTELIIDTQEKLRLQVENVKNLQTPKTTNLKRYVASTVDVQDSKKSNLKNKESEAIDDDHLVRKVKKNITNIDNKIYKETSEKVDQLREKKKEKPKVSYDKKNVNKEQIKKEKDQRQREKQDQILKEKENKHRAKRDRPLKEKENAHEPTQDQLPKQKEEKLQEKQDRLLREKEERLKFKDEQLKDKEMSKKKAEKDKPQKDEENAYLLNLKKMKDEQSKQKTEHTIIKKQQEEYDRVKTESLKSPKKRPGQTLAEQKTEKTLDLEKQKSDKMQEQPTKREVNMKDIKMRKPSPDDLILQLVKLRQSNKGERPQRLSDINITPLMINEHKVHKGKKLLSCAMCLDSDLELDVENIIINLNKSDVMNDVIIGNKIFKSKLPLGDKVQQEENTPMLFRSIFKDDVSLHQEEILENETVQNDHKQRTPLSHKYAEQELPKGVIRYALSDRSFIDKGWTMLPTEKVVRKMNVYRMRPAHPEFDWFDHNKNKRLMLYDTGEKLAEFDDNGRGRWFYKNGRIALDYYDAEEMNAQQRIVIYGSGEPDNRGRSQPISILATFDYLGNGVVFDHAGKIRLKYNQTEGVVLDREIGPVSQWKWHTLNDPPVLQQVMIDTQLSHKDPDILKLGGPADDKARPDNEEMLAIEFDNFIKEKSKKLSQKFKPFQIRTKALKINEHFSLRVLDQANVYLIFRDGKINIKMNIGMILDHHEIVDTDTAEVGEVSNNMERFPARTDSLAGLQRSVAHAQRVERLRVERERRLRPPQPSCSADQLVAAASRPLRSQLHIVASSSTVAKDKCYCKCRKPSSHNIYYDTRLV